MTEKILDGLFFEKISLILLYRMKIYTEYNLLTWLRIVNFMQLSVSEFLFLNFF